MLATGGGLNAKRFAGEPLRQPIYNFRDIPRCSKDLKGSTLQEVTDRQNWKDGTAEMVLLCNETMRRLHTEKKVGKRCYSKPLSLEYIADRLDVDDPMFGYHVRTNGMLQGFIAVTTFTNWQTTFRWDSMHDSAFAYDDKKTALKMASGERRYDKDGTLAEELQSTVRCGDPWNEGIVWPRIAEISLLGGMGCGKALVCLVIEKLECTKANGKRNYDYVALQATDNSIPFYESLGFVRVGAITEDDKFDEKRAKLKSDNDYSPSQGSLYSDTMPEIVSSAVQTYVTKKAWETPSDVAKKFNVDVWDIIFLNHFVFENIQPSSRLMKGTSLFVPSVEEAQAHATSHATRSRDLKAASVPQWYIASENDTPRMIAKQFGVSCSDLVTANRDRLAELQGISRLKEGTRIRVSHFHVDDDKHVPYCHWTFPDDTFEHTEPSYMMVRKLERRKGAAAKHRPVEASLAVPITQYTAPPQKLFKSVQAPPARAAAKTPKKKPPVLAGGPTKPKRPLTGYMIYFSEQREAMKDELAELQLHGKEVMKVVSKMWQELSERDKAAYQARAQMDQTRYQKAMEKYKQDLTAFHRAHPEQARLELVDPEPKSSGVDKNSLFNKVVKLNAEGSAQSGSEYEYFFVLTYIPDLLWCHLAPMVRVGKWGPDKSQAEGRPIWMLVNENEGKEVDISSAFCVPVKSRSMKRTADADREQWDILESGEPIFTNRVGTQSKGMSNASHSAMKHLSGSLEPKQLGQPRKHPPPANFAQAPYGYTDPTHMRGRPRIYPLSPTAVASHSASKARTGSIGSKKKVCRPRKHPLACKAAQSPSSPRGYTDPSQKRGRPRKYPLPDSVTKPSKAAGKRKIGTNTDYNEPSAQAASSRRSLSAAKPVTGTIEVKKKRGQPRKYPLPTDAAEAHSEAAGMSRIGSDTENESWEADVEKPRAGGRVQPARQSHSATKPLTGCIEPKMKRGRLCKKPVPADVAESRPSEEPVNGSAEQEKKLRRPRKQPSLCAVVSVEESDEAESPPTKRRKLPQRNVPPVFYGSPRSLNGSAVKAAPSTTRKAPVRGNSGNRKVALTRSGKKLSMASPLMFGPRAGARG